MLSVFEYTNGLEAPLTLIWYHAQTYMILLDQTPIWKWDKHYWKIDAISFKTNILKWQS